MRTFFKWIILISYLSILALSVYLTIISSLWYIISDIILIVILGLSITSTNESDFQFTLTRLRTYKKIVHEAGVYFLRYNKQTKKYELYADRYLFRDIILKIYPSEIESKDLPPEKKLAQIIKSNLDNIYSERITENKRCEVINKWDGYTSDQLKRDDKINKII